MWIDWIQVAGYTASGLVFLTFYMKTMIPLRVIAIMSNVAFMTYGFGGRLYPVLILHAILLPLNCMRLVQMRALIRKVSDAAGRGDLSMEWLTPFMRHTRRPAGEVLFRRGDQADDLYAILSGTVRLPDIGVSLGPGNVFGEIGIFTAQHQRMATAVCETDVELGVIANEKVLELYHQNPRFGLYLTRLISQRLSDDYAAMRDAAERAAGAAQRSAAKDLGARA